MGQILLVLVHCTEKNLVTLVRSLRAQILGGDASENSWKIAGAKFLMALV
jgi:hypothetical protein